MPNNYNGYTDEERKELKEIEDKKTSLGWIAGIFLIPFYEMYSAVHGITMQNELLKIAQENIKEKQKNGETLSPQEQDKLKEEKIGFGWKILAIFFFPYGIYRAFKRFSIEEETAELKKQILHSKHLKNKEKQNIPPGKGKDNTPSNERDLTNSKSKEEGKDMKNLDSLNSNSKGLG